MLGQDPQSTAASSPFSLPLPEFDRALFPSFAGGMPTIASLPPLLSENEAKAALTEPSAFYFLEQAGLVTASDKAAKDKAAKNAPEPNV
jgi:hypothetical protein